VTPHFTREELECRHCGAMEFTELALDRLEALREEFGKPMVVSSGFRCPAHNREVGRTGLCGPHTRVDRDNVTVDIQVYGADALELLGLALGYGLTGLGVHQKDDHDQRILHLDWLTNDIHAPRPYIWSY
jgi:uncharacterized protein YcbK (DUF882 family)